MRANTLIMRPRLAHALIFSLMPVLAQAATCHIDFAITVTQGVGTIRPGAGLTGTADFTATGTSFRGEGGATVHLATGEMRLGGDVTGEIWALVTTSQGAVADLVGVQARNVRGLSFAGIGYRGPMTISLYGRPGSRPDTAMPTTQTDWDAMDLRRSFALHAQGYDRLAGDITALTVTCG